MRRLTRVLPTTLAPRVLAVLILPLSPLPTTPILALTWIVPGVANTLGADGRDFKSSITMVNPAALPVEVTLSIVPSPDLPPPTPRSYTIAPGATLWLRDLLGDGLAFPSSGALRISAPDRIAVFGETWRYVYVGGFVGFLTQAGTSLPVFEETQLLQAGDVGHSPWVEQHSDRVPGARTNVAVAFPASDGGKVLVTLYGEEGQVRGSLSLEASQPAFLQRSLASFGPRALSRGRIEVRVLRGSVCGYTGVVDDATGDVSIFPTEPVPPDPPPSAPVDLVSVGVAQISGRFGSFWETDARIANPGLEDVGVTAYFLGVTRVEVPSAQFFVPAGQTIEFRNLVQSLFHVSDSVTGAVLWRASAPLSIAAVTRNAALGGPRLGASRSALPLAHFSTPADPPAQVANLFSLPSVRTNLLAVAGPEGAAYELDLLDEEGRLVATAPQKLAPFGWAQFGLDDFFKTDAVPFPLRGRARLSSGSVTIQAAVADNLYNVLVFYEATPRGSVGKVPASTDEDFASRRAVGRGAP